MVQWFIFKSGLDHDYLKALIGRYWSGGNFTGSTFYFTVEDNTGLFEKLLSHSEEHITNMTDRYTALVVELDSVCFIQWLLYFKYDKNFPYQMIDLGFSL